MKKKSLFKWVATTAMAVTLTCSATLGVSAATVDATDAEDDTVATAVAVNTSKRGTIQSKQDVDMFSFTTDGTDSFYEFKMINIGCDKVYYKLSENADFTEDDYERKIRTTHPPCGSTPLICPLHYQKCPSPHLLPLQFLRYLLQGW